MSGNHPPPERFSDQITKSKIPHLPTTISPRKRKLNTASTSEQQLRKRKYSATENEDVDILMGINRVFGSMNNHLLADYVAQRTRKFEDDLSPVEWNDRYIPAVAICDTASWNSPRNLENLPGFLENFSSSPTKLWSASKKMGAPHTIIVAGAGLRAADLARVLRKYQTKDVKVAKLFAKHIKVKDAIKFLRHTRTGIAVGTPMRLNELMDYGALSIDKLERIVVDASHIDQKKRGVLDMRETQVPLVHWLNRKVLRERFGQRDNGFDLIFF